MPNVSGKSSSTKTHRLTESDKQLVKYAVARLTCKCGKYPSPRTEDIRNNVCFYCRECERPISLMFADYSKVAWRELVTDNIVVASLT